MLSLRNHRKSSAYGLGLGQSCQQITFCLYFRIHICRKVKLESLSPMLFSLAALLRTCACGTYMRRGISARDCVNMNDAMHEGDYTCMVYELNNAEHKDSSWQLGVRWFSKIQNSADTHITLLCSSLAWTIEANIYSLWSCDMQLKCLICSPIYY